MLHKTRGIVLHSIPYNDKYTIIHMYTETFGRVSYLVSRSRGRKTAVSKSLFIPLSILDLEVEHYNNRDLHRIKEAKSCFTQHEIACHPVKNLLALFLSEFLFRVLRETEPDEKLFNYLYEAIRFLEISSTGIANFHITFLLHLPRYMGIYPNTESYTPNSYFDMLNAVFTEKQPMHRHFLEQKESLVLARLLKMSFENMSLYAFSRHDRVEILRLIIEYYRLHLPDFPEINSLSVLQSLFD